MSERIENRLVLVDLTELGRGLETTFTGVAMVFGSLGKTDAEIKTALSGVAMPTVGAKEPAEPAEESVEAEAETPNETPNDTSAETPDPKQSADTPNTSTTPATPTPTPAHPTVTADDITKVIVAKIKQKRSNNAKIGALLKTYGVEKVSSLPEEKYEAFLTDISQL